MWLSPLFHFIVSTLISFILWRVFQFTSGETSYSLPTSPLVMGVVCATLSHFLSPWSTPVVLLLYVLTLWSERRRE